MNYLMSLVFRKIMMLGESLLTCFDVGLAIIFHGNEKDCAHFSRLFLELVKRQNVYHAKNY